MSGDGGPHSSLSCSSATSAARQRPGAVRSSRCGHMLVLVGLILVGWAETSWAAQGGRPFCTSAPLGGSVRGLRGGMAEVATHPPEQSRGGEDAKGAGVQGGGREGAGQWGIGMGGDGTEEGSIYLSSSSGKLLAQPSPSCGNLLAREIEAAGREDGEVRSARRSSTPPPPGAAGHHGRRAAVRQPPQGPLEGVKERGRAGPRALRGRAEWMGADDVVFGADGETPLTAAEKLWGVPGSKEATMCMVCGKDIGGGRDWYMACDKRHCSVKCAQKSAAVYDEKHPPADPREPTAVYLCTIT